MIRLALRLASVLAVTVAGCSAIPHPDHIPFTPRPVPVSESAPTSGPMTPSTYLLGAGDHLRIDTYGEAGLSGEYVISTEGVIAFPLIGKVPALGRTAQQVATAVEAGLRNGYINSPSVSAQVLTYRPVFILGEVQRPGGFPYVAGLTAPAAVALAGGFTYRANKGYAYIKNEGQPAETKVRLEAGTPILPGATVRIGERYF